MDSPMNLDTNSTRKSSAFGGEVAVMAYFMTGLTEQENGSAWVGTTAKDEKERFELLEKQLIDAVIEAYESVLAAGLPANIAMSSLLQWMAQECPRIGLPETA